MRKQSYLRIILAIVMTISFFSFNVFAFDSISNSTIDTQESFEKAQINERLNSQEFARLLMILQKQDLLMNVHLKRY